MIITGLMFSFDDVDIDVEEFFGELSHIEISGNLHHGLVNKIDKVINVDGKISIKVRKPHILHCFCYDDTDGNKQCSYIINFDTSKIYERDSKDSGWKGEEITDENLISWIKKAAMGLLKKEHHFRKPFEKALSKIM